MATLLRTVRESLWVQRFFALVLGCNIALILWGFHVVPADLTPDGVATALGVVCMQMAIGVLAFFGPLAFQRFRSSIGIALVLGMLFAIAYDGILLAEFSPQLNPTFNVLFLFMLAAGLAGFIAGYRSHRFGHGVVIAIWAPVIGTAIWSIGWLIINYIFWGSSQWLFFWQNDGAIDEFQHSGETNLQVFLINDIHGAMFFHPLLSVAVGVIFGLATSGLAQGVVALRRKAARQPAF